MQAKNDPASVAADSLQRMSAYLGEKTTLQCSTSLIKGAIASQDWKEQAMGYTFLGMISEACKKQFSANLEDVAKMSVSGFAHPNPRVRFEALQSTGLLLTDLAPKFQSTYHADLIPALLKMMNEEVHLKMQFQATACMTSLIRGLIDEESAEDSEVNVQNKKLLVPYATDLAQSIANLFQRSIDEKYQPLQEEILSTLSCLASVLDTHFEAHYNKFMPGLKNILASVKWETQQEQELRASCIEAIGYILTSVKDKPEVCRADASEICKNLIETLTQGNLKDTDPQITTIANTISQICVCLKEDFKPFLPAIIPQLLKDATRDLDFKVQTFDDDEEAEGDDAKKEGYAAVNLRVKGLEGQQHITMNTHALDVKINAIQILKNLARNLREHIFEYVEDISQVCINQLLNDPYASTIRKESAKCMRFCIDACHQHPEKQRALFIMTYMKMMEELEKRKERKDAIIVNQILKEIQKMLKVFWDFKDKNLTVFSVEDATTFLQRLQQTCAWLKEIQQNRMKKVKELEKNIDEEDMETLYEDIEKVDKGFHHIMEINGCLLQNNGEQLSQVIATTLLPLYAQVLLNISDKKDYELIDSVCFICDCLEYGNKALFDQVQGQAGQKFIEIIQVKSKAADDVPYGLIQSCIFGLGLIAQKQPNG